MAEYFRTEQWLDSFIAAVRDVVTRPGEFFEGMPKAEGYGPAIVFFTITLAVPFVIYALISLGLALIAAPFVWVLGLATTWVWAWYLGWAVRMFAKGSLDTVNAFQICAYANVPVLLSWVPIVGPLVGIWTLVLQWYGLTRHAKVGSGAALAIILVPALILSLSIGALIVLLGVAASQMPEMQHMMQMGF